MNLSELQLPRKNNVSQLSTASSSGWKAVAMIAVDKSQVEISQLLGRHYASLNRRTLLQCDDACSSYRRRNDRGSTSISEADSALECTLPTLFSLRCLLPNRLERSMMYTTHEITPRVCHANNPCRRIFLGDVTCSATRRYSLCSSALLVCR